jgi:hypothetical protein
VLLDPLQNGLLGTSTLRMFLELIQAQTDAARTL